MKKIALLGGSWSSNIGNAFYNIGAEWLLNNLGANTYFFPESPRWKENISVYYDAIADIDADLFILVGPCLWQRLAYVYEKTFQAIYQKGKQVGYLSAGMATYTDEEADFIAQFLEKFPPAFLSTRDHLCFNLISQRCHFPLHNGLCTSMFLNNAITPIKLKRSPFIVLNFDHEEPELKFDNIGRASIIKKQTKNPPVSIGNTTIIRTINLSIDEGYPQIYRRPNSYHSDLPYGYLSILSSAEVVYSERVHTCAAALIYGQKAQFIRKSKRSFEKRNLLFERIGVGNIFDLPIHLNLDFIEKEKKKMQEFIRSKL